MYMKELVFNLVKFGSQFFWYRGSPVKQRHCGLQLLDKLKGIGMLSPDLQITSANRCLFFLVSKQIWEGG